MNLNLTVKGKGKKVVLLHGFGFSQNCFDSLVERLSFKYQFYLIDLPGFGQSKYVAYTLDELTVSLRRILPEKACFLGWSLGGNIALAYAAKYPDNVEALLLVASNPLFTSNSPWPSMPLMAFEQFVNACRKDINKTLLHFLNLQFPKNKRCKILYRVLKQSLEINHLTTQAAINALMMLKEVDLRQSYNSLTVPVANILGRMDQLVPAELSETLSKYKKNKQWCYMLEASAHIPFMTEEALFIQIMDDFLC